MAQYDHLQLKRTSEPFSRRKRQVPVPQPDRNITSHGRKVSADIEQIISNFRSSSSKESIDPTLILKAIVSGSVSDDEWSKVDLTLLSHVDDNIVVLFSDDTQLKVLSNRAEAYGGDKPETQKTQPYSGFFNAIDGFEPLSAEDRIGRVLKRDGFLSPESFLDAEEYLLDVEVWRPSADMVPVFIDRVVGVLEKFGGEELGRYTPPSGVLIRVKGSGAAIRSLLDLVEVATIDTPPQPDLESGGIPDIELEELGEVHSPLNSTVRIGIVDSGVNDGHPLLEKVVTGSFGVGGEPAWDDKGHGTAVAAIAAYGDLEAMLDNGSFAPRFEVASARVVDANGKFPDMELAPQLVEEAIRKLCTEYQCRVINLSLCDPDRPIAHRGTLWTEVLDDLARELDVVIVVSVGNTSLKALTTAHEERVVDEYPSYLLDKANRLLDPAGALNVVSVGSLAHVNGISVDDDVTIRPIAGFNEPSPFTRTGPGVFKAVKPDFVEYGGTAVYDGLSQKIRGAKVRPTTGIMSLHYRYTERLFSTFSGTSFAAPLVAHKAAILIERFPKASANFIRTLLAIGADGPEDGLEKMEADHPRERLAVFGNGHPDIGSALFSDDDRVVMVAESQLEPDQFAVFEIPITDEFQIEPGKREIKVALAFDPPIRRSRKEYTGIQMRFDMVRGSDEGTVFNAFRELLKDSDGKTEEAPPGLLDRQKCEFIPGIMLRKPSTLQCGTFVAQRDISQYGGSYYLVVSCLRRWAVDVEMQPFTVAVMLRHSSSIKLYERLRARVAVGV